MRKFLYILTSALSILLTFLIILVGLYIADPDIKAGVDGSLNRNSIPGTDVPGPGSGQTGTTASDSTPVVSPDADSPSNGITPATTYDPAADPSDPADYLAPDVMTGYEAPSDTFLDIPENVVNKTGSEDEISADLRTLPDPEADLLENELSEGNTGEDLDFDPLIYPYYHMLDDQSKLLYRQIYANAMDRFDDFKAVEPRVNPAQLNNAFVAVISDHPELYHINTEYAATYRNNGTCLEIQLYLNDLSNDYDRTKAEFENAAQSLKDSSPSDPYEYEKAVHAALADMDIYSLDAPYNQSGYSSLVGGQTVCAGYSRAFQYVCQLAGIPCYYCSGYAGEAHAWNIICLDGDFYNVDVTWDDTDSPSVYTYEWFNRTDEDYGTSHIRKDLSVYLPPCNGTKYRDLEESPQDDTSADYGKLADYGFDESDVIYDLQEYYDRFRDIATAFGIGDFTFDLPVNDNEMVDIIRNKYESDESDSEFFDPLLDSMGATRIDVTVYPVQVEGGRFVLRHQVNMQ